MRSLLVALAVTCIVTPGLTARQENGQDNAAPKAGISDAAASAAQRLEKAEKKDKADVLSGCVSPKAGPTGEFVFEDSASGSAYRVEAKRVRKYAGRRVELVLGSRRRGLVIRGGLLPSPNIAAQAGHIDPAQEAIASQPGGWAVAGTGTPAPRIVVTKVRALPGPCHN